MNSKMFNYPVRGIGQTAKIAACFAAAILFFVRPLPAQVVYDANTEAELISEVLSLKPGEPFWVGLRLKTDPHWHTYWRNAGDSGIPTMIRWTLPEGFKAGDIQWPYPQRIDIDPLTGYGYEDEIILLVQLTPPDQMSQNSVEIKARVDWLACEISCVPGRGDFTLTLPVSDQAAIDSKWKTAFDASRKRMPAKDPRWSFSAIDRGDNYLLDIQTTDRSRITSIQFFPFSDSLLIHAAAQDFRMLSPGQYQLPLAKNLRGQTADMKSLDGVVVIDREDSVRAIEVSATVIKKNITVETGFKPVSTKDSAVSGGLPLVLVFAFLGGMILNLMPCVFPVLSIKVLSFVKHAQNRPALLKLAFGYTLGVVGSFAGLAILLIILRAGGQSIGWGFQFQSPAFVIGMILLLYMMALNLFGLFEVRIPGIASRQTSGQLNFNEAVFGGVLAVVVATPCTAPFMGTALSFALTQGSIINILIFVCLGLGMALPFVALCVFPSMLKALPKPGLWMETFKKFLAFPLLATIIWLLWVLEAQKGFTAVMWMLGALLIITLGIWMLSVVRSVFWHAIAWALIATAIIVPCIQIRTLSAAAVSSDDVWMNYDPQLIEELEKDGRIIFYDFTARWCLTCQVNEKVVLAHPDVMKAFQDMNVALVKGDWTNRDETITQILNEFGRNSVPVYVLSYPSGGTREEKILPELLTNNIVLDSLASIKNK